MLNVILLYTIFFGRNVNVDYRYNGYYGHACIMHRLTCMYKEKTIML